MDDVVAGNAKEPLPPPGREHRLAELAAGQHGLVTAQQLRALGIAASTITRRAHGGRLHRIHRGVYAVGHASLSRESRWLAAVLAVQGSLLSHVAAGRLFGIWKRGADSDIHVVVPHSRPDLVVVTVHRSRTPIGRDATVRLGIPVTSVARTLVDLGDMLTPHQLANCLHEAAFRQMLDEEDLVDVMSRSRGRRGLGVVLGSLTLRAGGSVGTRSFLEDRYLAAMARAGLPEPRVNVGVVTGGGTIEVDFHWPAERVCLEVDGPAHGRAVTRAGDEARDGWLGTAGYEVFRCGPRQVRATVERLRRVLASRR